MRARSILPVSLLVLLLGGVVTVFVYDLRRENLIAEGVRVAGVDVGGLHASAAHDKLSRELQASLTDPVLVRGPERTFRLTPRAAAATYDVGGMVDSAVRRSREGNAFTRTWREIRGRRLRVNLPADLQYSRLVVNRFVARVDRAITRKPIDAHLTFVDGYPRRRPGKYGYTVSAARLRADVTAALTGATPDRVVEVAVTKRKPKVLRANLEREYPQLITIDRSSFKLRYFRRLQHVKTYSIAVGAVGFDTPVGMYQVQNKAINPAWSVPNKPWAGSLAGRVIPGGTAQNPLKARWLGIYNGAGIHGTDQTGSIGSRASHGCIRMLIPDVIELYDRVPVGAPVYIA